jgi:ferric-dicitrate binding protein FerR (iron transport regulator)
MDDLQLSISQFLDGELSDDETQQLAEYLHTNVESLDQFLMSNYIHYQLLDWMDQDRLPDHAVDGLLADGDDSAVGGVTHPTAKRPTATPRASRWLRSWGALAATLLVAATIGSLAYVMASRQDYVGQLSDTTNCSWGSANGALAVGAMLESGQQLELVKGNAVITFSSGAKLMMEGHTTLRIHSPMEVELLGGQVAVKVPRQAVGFMIDSSLADFIDLGTAFTLDLKAEKSFNLHVFEGLVELHLDERFGKAAKRPARIAEVRAVSFDVKSGDIETMHFEEGKDMPF